MPPTTSEATQARVLELIEQRADTYESCVQTSVCWRSDSGWRNSVTKLEFTRKGEKLPAGLTYKYPDIHIVRRLFPPKGFTDFLARLVEKHILDSDKTEVSFEGAFSSGGKARQPHSEWSQWPADIFVMEPQQGQNYPPNQPLIDLSAPYYPSLGHVLSDICGIRVQNWTNYLRGELVVVLPDFRARISKLTVALAYVRADLECVFSQPDKLILKAYAENRNGRLAQETIQVQEPFVQIDLPDRPSLVSTALLCVSTGDVLDERVYQEGVSWREPNVVVEPVAPEIEQLLLTGESETIEFKEKLDTNSLRFAKTATAFANTNGGTIVFGIDDDHRVVGCDIRGMADTITNILRSRCDPPPTFTTKIIKYEDKELLLVQVAPSSSAVHVVKELGPFIRASGSNRTPTSHELELLWGRRGSGGVMPLSSNWIDR